jgi:hypothetical protein
MELWPLLLFLLFTSGTAGAGNTNFFCVRTSPLPGNFLRPISDASPGKKPVFREGSAEG